MWRLLPSHLNRLHYYTKLPGGFSHRTPPARPAKNANSASCGSFATLPQTVISYCFSNTCKSLFVCYIGFGVSFLHSVHGSRMNPVAGETALCIALAQVAGRGHLGKSGDHSGSAGVSPVGQTDIVSRAARVLLCARGSACRLILHVGIGV